MRGLSTLVAAAIVIGVAGSASDAAAQVRLRYAHVGVANAPQTLYADEVAKTVKERTNGRVEIQVYAVGRGERAAVRSRQPQGVHLPHPAIAQATGRQVEIRADRGPLPVELDGVAAPSAALVTVAVLPGAFLLVV